MKSIFDKQACQNILSRLDVLTPEDQAKWGIMNVSQMLKHCQKPIKLAFDEEKVEKPNFIMKLLIKLMKPTLYNDKPWKQGLPTAKSFVITENLNFENEKSDLKQLINRIHKSDSYFEPSKRHPIFGEMESYMWGQSVYKHLDHHLKQFGR